MFRTRGSGTPSGSEERCWRRRPSSRATASESFVQACWCATLTTSCAAPRPIVRSLAAPSRIPRAHLSFADDEVGPSIARRCKPLASTAAELELTFSSRRNLRLRNGLIWRRRRWGVERVLELRLQAFFSGREESHLEVAESVLALKGLGNPCKALSTARDTTSGEGGVERTAFSSSQSLLVLLHTLKPPPPP